MEPGDLVKSKKHKAMGIVIDVFGDLDPENRWVRVLFSGPPKTSQWCKEQTLTVVSKSDSPKSGSL